MMVKNKEDLSRQANRIKGGTCRYFFQVKSSKEIYPTPKYSRANYPMTYLMIPTLIDLYPNELQKT